MLAFPIIYVLAAQVTDLSWISALGGVDNLTPSVLLGVVVLMILFGFLIPRFVYMRLAKEVEYLRETNKELQATVNAALDNQAKVANVLVAIKNTLNSMLPPDKHMRVGGDEDDVDVAKSTLEEA